MRPLVLGTRGSSLAMCQAQIVQAKLEERFPGRRIDLQTIKAQADQQPELSLIAMGGEGVFVKELEAALLGDRIDCAVHSLKDLPLATPEGLRIAAVLEREEPRDALVSRSGEPFDRLPAGSRLGTSRLRRRSQLCCRRRDLDMVEIRGNVDTRLRKLDEGRYDAIVLAACGLIRLGLEERITEYLDFSLMLPEPGQGALAVEVRADDDETLELLRALEDAPSRACVEAERAFLQALGGGCRVPIAAYASLDGGTLRLEGAVIAADGHHALRGTMEGPMTEPIDLGHRLANQLIAQGAKDLLNV
ncbi:MAG: hydroxymethylbilane synthase [Candidatus Omnitrophica bacterium]|nr:hydroxymethylbilane synthase [Candidatus Omnitrophota bacterium]